MTHGTRQTTARTRPAGAALAATALALLLVGCGSATTEESDGGAAASESESASPSPSPTESSATVDTGPGAGGTGSAVPSPGAPEGEAALPACSTIWTAGATLPGRYSGCTDGDGSASDQVTTCESGQKLASYRDTFWAVPGGRVTQVGSLSGDAGFRDAQASCTG